MSEATGVLMYATAYCPYCMRARQLLQSKSVAWHEVDVGAQPHRRHEMTEKSGGQRTVPQIWIGNRHIGGCDELHALDRRGELDALLAAVAGNDRSK